MTYLHGLHQTSDWSTPHRLRNFLKWTSKSWKISNWQFGLAFLVSQQTCTQDNNVKKYYLNCFPVRFYSVSAFSSWIGHNCLGLTIRDTFAYEVVALSGPFHNILLVHPCLSYATKKVFFIFNKVWCLK